MLPLVWLMFIKQSTLWDKNDEYTFYMYIGFNDGLDFLNIIWLSTRGTKNTIKYTFEN